MFSFLDPARNRHAGLIFTLCVLCGPIALIIGGWAAWNAHSKQPWPTENYIRLNTVASQVELFADQIVRLSLTGSANNPEDRARLAAMVVDPRAVALPPTPWNVTSTHVDSIRRVAQEFNSAEWEVEVLVGYSPPGSGAVRFNTMIVNILSSRGAYKATALPRFANFARPPMQVGPGYTAGVDLNSALGTAVKDFADAFYKPVGGSNMGRLVTKDFSGTPVKGSPFTSISVRMIMSKNAAPIEPAPGDSVDVLATIRGAASDETWYNMQVPMRLVYTDQKQWAVSEILETVDVGKIIHQ